MWLSSRSVQVLTNRLIPLASSRGMSSTSRDRGRTRTNECVVWRGPGDNERQRRQKPRSPTLDTFVERPMEGGMTHRRRVEANGEVDETRCEVVDEFNATQTTRSPLQDHAVRRRVLTVQCRLELQECKAMDRVDGGSHGTRRLAAAECMPHDANRAASWHSTSPKFIPSILDNHDIVSTQNDADETEDAPSE